MFTLFKKQQKADTATPAQPPPQALDKIISALKELQSQEVADAMKAAAEANERIVEENQQELERMQKETPFFVSGQEKRIHFEDGLYILPNELERYHRLISLFNAVYQAPITSAKKADALDSNEIEPLLLYYIAEFKQSLIDGQKRKADICWNMLKYTAIATETPLPNIPEEERQERMKKRKRIIEETGKAALDVVNYIYGSLFNLSSNEAAYQKDYDEYVKHKDDFDSIPDEYIEIMETLGFDGVKEQYPEDHPIRAFVDQEIVLRHILDRMEAYLLNIETLQAQIEKLYEQLELLEKIIHDADNEESNEPVVLNYDDLIAQLNAVSKPGQQKSAAEKQPESAEKSCTLNDLIVQLRKLQEPSEFKWIEMTAERNAIIAKANQAELERMQTEAPESAPYLEKWISLTDGLYILPQDLQRCRDQIDILVKIYENAAAKNTENELDPLISQYIDEFQQALTDGKKRKAEVYFAVLKYAVMVAHDKPLSDMKSKRRKSLERRKILISTTANAALRTINNIYGLLVRISSDVTAYNKTNEACAKYQKRLEALPDDYIRVIESHDFNDFLSAVSGGTPAERLCQ